MEQDDILPLNVQISSREKYKTPSNEEQTVSNQKSLVTIPQKRKIHQIPDGKWGLEIKKLRKEHENYKRNEKSDTNSGYELETGVGFEEFVKHGDRLMGDSKNRVFFINGKVLIYEFVSNIHERTSIWIVGGFITNQNVYDTCYFDGSSIIIFNAGTVDIPNNVVYEPDQSIIPKRRGGPATNNSGCPFPTLVVEVGYSQSLQSLHTKAQQYINANTNIQMVICISIWPRRPNNTFQSLILFYRRTFAGTNPEQIISFGTAPLHHSTSETINTWNLGANQLTGFGITVNGVATPACNQLGMAQYTLQIPTADLYNGVPDGVPNGVPANIPLDLFNLQTYINEIPNF